MQVLRQYGSMLLAAAAGAAIFGLAASLCLAFDLSKRGLQRPAFLACVLSPLVAATLFAVTAGLVPLLGERSKGVDASATTPGAGAAATAPTAATDTSPSEVGIHPTEGAAADVAAWRAEAAQLRSARNFTGARDVYARIVNATPGDADAWADFADASAAAADGDLNAGAVGIDHALRIDPNHAKALWLKASLELQSKHYASAATLWQRLLAQLPSESNDARIVRANLDEARALAARTGAGS